jgi:hypothetical protein
VGHCQLGQCSMGLIVVSILVPILARGNGDEQ